MPTPKAVIDTSVIVSVAFAREGLAREMRDMIADGAFTLVTSKAIMAELYRVLHYPHILKLLMDRTNHLLAIFNSRLHCQFRQLASQFSDGYIFWIFTQWGF